MAEDQAPGAGARNRMRLISEAYLGVMEVLLRYFQGSRHRTIAAGPRCCSTRQW